MCSMPRLKVSVPDSVHHIDMFYLTVYIGQLDGHAEATLQKCLMGQTSTFGRVHMWA